MALAQPTEPGAAAAAMGGSYITQYGAIGSRHNVAGIAGTKQNELAVGARNNYLANNLNDFYAATSLVQKKGALGLDLAYFGLSTFQQTQIGVSYALPVAKNWLFGARIGYAYNAIPQENINRHFVAADFGVLGSIKKWRLGFALQNAAQSGWQGRVNEREPIVFRGGFGYHFTAKNCITAELHKSNQTDADVRLGLAYAPIDQLTIRLGISTLRPAVGFGLGLKLANFEVNLTATWHQQLGLSPLTDVGYAW